MVKNGKKFNNSGEFIYYKKNNLRIVKKIIET